MDEVVAGSKQPLDSDELHALLARLLPRIQEATNQAAALRKRVVNGEAQVTYHRGRAAQGLPMEVAEADLVDAEARLAALKSELRLQEAWEVTGLGLALSRALAAVLSETGQDEGWRPPKGSYIQVVLPGLLRVAIDLHDQSHKRVNGK